MARKAADERLDMFKSFARPDYDHLAPPEALPDERAHGLPAILGGPKVRADKMPPRRAFGPAENEMIEQALAHFRERDMDPGYQGHFEDLYTDTFTRMMGGGYADAVATGTSALFVAIAALDLPKGSEVLVSPITDPGSISAIILNGLKPRLMDSRPDNFNAGVDQFVDALTPDVSAVMYVHSIGQPGDIERISAIARAKRIRVLEDCSQSHGARIGNRPVGTFGDIAALSTMYRKAHVAGASGGMVYTRNRALFEKALAHADRGKARCADDFDDRDPNKFLFPALNHHTDELSCAVGIASLARLNDTIERRLDFVADFTDRLREMSSICRPYGFTPGDSPFIYPVIVDTKRIRCSKQDFAAAIEAEGIGLNPHYQYLVCDWPWLKPHLAEIVDTPNARSIRDRCFALYLNENYGQREAEDAVAAIVKLERYFGF
jgi:dTDP-4-amino-4,6-dideoxygalactose transaminase